MRCRQPSQSACQVATPRGGAAAQPQPAWPAAARASPLAWGRARSRGRRCGRTRRGCAASPRCRRQRGWPRPCQTCRWGGRPGGRPRAGRGRRAPPPSRAGTGPARQQRARAKTAQGWAAREGSTSAGSERAPARQSAPLLLARPSLCVPHAGPCTLRLDSHHARPSACRPPATAGPPSHPQSPARVPRGPTMSASTPSSLRMARSLTASYGPSMR